ncbi:MAG: tRNA (adenosine(37)-N6)-threonylcarbamoyltransferase complex ATPase subunit type 1 TsaE [Candidatus Paceibacterota bacterium]
MKETVTIHIDDLRTLAEKVAGLLSSMETPRAKVLLLEGGLGAGKTTFTKELASVLGIEKEEVHSPTFILKKEYKTKHPHFTKLVHIDAYRFTHPKEAKVLRLEEDLLEPQTLIAIEWPSKMKYLQSDMEMEFDVIDEDTRDVTLTYEKK